MNEKENPSQTAQKIAEEAIEPIYLFNIIII